MGQLLWVLAQSFSWMRSGLQQYSGLPFKQLSWTDIEECLNSRESTMATATLPPPLPKKDFQTDHEVRWCPGCGDYAILFRSAGSFSPNRHQKEHFSSSSSGIGCSSRFPYYITPLAFEAGATAGGGRES